MKWKVLVTAPYMQPVIERFRNEFSERGVELVIPPVFERMEEEDLLQWVHDIDGVICGDDRFTRRVIEAAPHLKVLSKWGTGIDSLDASACNDHGVIIRRTPNAFSIPVAETVIGYILCFTRNLPFMDRAIRGGTWEKIQGRTLQECTLGIIGVGDVGKAVARSASLLGMRVMGNDIKKMSEDFILETGIHMTDKEALFTSADFVSLHTDLNPTSFHLMSDQQFGLMRNDAVVINTCRGPVVDEPALVNALKSRRIAGAALDVYEEEPLPASSPLRNIDNVLLSSHNANSSPIFWESVHRSTIENIMEELERGAS
jgi:phosphoglycerate dehydrogenase-like enzyme